MVRNPESNHFYNSLVEGGATRYIGFGFIVPAIGLFSEQKNSNVIQAPWD